LSNNRNLIEEYVKELLAVELPSLELKSEQTDALIVNSVCISIENLKIIYDLLINNKEDIMKINKQVLKQAERIDNVIEASESFLRVNPFEPQQPFFKYVCVEGDEKLEAKEFKEALHYVILKKVTSKKLESVNLQLKKWQQCLIKILSETNLTSLCQRIEQITETNEQGERTLVELFKQMHKCPKEYLLSAKKEGQVRIMGHFLVKYFLEANTKEVLEELDYLKDVYYKDIKQMSIQQQSIEQSLRLTTNSLSNKVSIILNEIKENDSDVFECTLARKFILEYKCAYEIRKYSPGDKKDKVKVTAPHYAILFQENTKKGKKPKVEIQPFSFSE